MIQKTLLALFIIRVSHEPAYHWMINSIFRLHIYKESIAILIVMNVASSLIYVVQPQNIIKLDQCRYTNMLIVIQLVRY